jgi:hypothetical protein
MKKEQKIFQKKAILNLIEKKKITHPQKIVNSPTVIKM